MPDTSVLPYASAAPASHVDPTAVAEFFATRAYAIDHAEADVRDGLRWLGQRGLLGLGLDRQDGAGLEPMGELLALVAEQCMASAFALWCHHMVLEYVSSAPDAAFPRARLAARLLAVDLLGSTALGSAMAHAVTGAPLTVGFRREGDIFVLDGRIAWASNLLTDPDAAITVTAALGGDGQRIVAAIPLDAPGVEVAPYPELLALRASRSSSMRLNGVRIPTSLVVAHDLATFLPRIRPAFLALQSSFCWGLTRAALAGARAELRGTDATFADDQEQLEARLRTLESQLRENLRQPDATCIPMRTFVQTRLDFARLAGAATRLELAVRGGRAYRVDDPAGRRFREAAFLPVQAPTEGQLRWELARSA